VCAAPKSWSRPVKERTRAVSPGRMFHLSPTPATWGIPPRYVRFHGPLTPLGRPKRRPRLRTAPTDRLGFDPAATMMPSLFKKWTIAQHS
jgi:hypothetical protein